MLGSPEIADKLDRRLDITDLGVNNSRWQRPAGFARARVRLIRVLTKAGDDKLALPGERRGESVDDLGMRSNLAEGNSQPYPRVEHCSSLGWCRGASAALRGSRFPATLPIERGARIAFAAGFDLQRNLGLAAVWHGLGGRVADRQSSEIGLHVCRPVTDKPAQPNERDAGAGDAILLQRRSGAAGYLLYVSVRKQGVEHVLPLGDAQQRRAARDRSMQKPEKAALKFPESIISGLTAPPTVYQPPIADNRFGCCSRSF